MRASSEGLVALLSAHERKDLLRFITCGSVDDGKSTLIGRLLYEGNLLPDDQRESLKAESLKIGTQRENLDFALLVDGLAAEREQGITIDVAYRFFTTSRRQFIVADTPGHEQYTRNMATGASTAELAVILSDVSRGTDLTIQTKRHSYICNMLGIRHVVLAVNKMDLVGYREQVFNAYKEKYLAFARQLGIADVQCIPVSALCGDNVIASSAEMPWYAGPALLPYLESVDVSGEYSDLPFRMPVQWVNRPDRQFRGYCGTIISGTLKPGDRIRVLPSGEEVAVTRIAAMDGDLPEALCGHSITAVVDREIDISRGDVLSAGEHPVPVADQFAASILWMSQEAMLPGRSYVFRLATVTARATITALKHRINTDTLERAAGRTLGLNEIGLCNISLDKPVAFARYAENRELGGFILIDRVTNQTVGMGTISFALRRADNIHRQKLEVSQAERAALKGQEPAVLWFTGLSGSGKSTIASRVEKRLHELGRHTYVLDGDNIRYGLSRDLGFTDADRVENIRRVAEVARLMADAGLMVLACLIAPFRREREMVRSLMSGCRFIEIFVDAPLEVCEQRDPKGLYRKARRGEIRNFTGIDSPYEPPAHPDLRLDTTKLSPDEAADLVIERLFQNE